MKLGFGLYKESLNESNYRFVKQIGASHVIVHPTNYFKGNNPEISSGDNNGWGVCENEPIWDYEMLFSLKKELQDKISNVVVSSRLTKSPIILIAEESGVDINMEKLMKMHNKTMPDTKKILEINPIHPMIIKLSESLTKIDHKKLSSLLLDQANILDGNILTNPTNYIDSLTELFIQS